MKHSVEEILLCKNGIDRKNIENLLSDLKKKEIYYADLYFQSMYKEKWNLENKIITEGIYSFNQGVGVRAIEGESTNFSYSNEISIKSLQENVSKVKSFFKKKKAKNRIQLHTKKYFRRYPYTNPLSEMKEKEKIDILKKIDAFARSLDPRVKKVNASLEGNFEKILIASTDENISSDIRPLIQLHVSILVEENGKREVGRVGSSSRDNYNYLLQKNKLQEDMIGSLIKEAIRIALINLSAKDAPSGFFPVVLGPGWPGVLLHEAVGHGLEGDFNRKKTSFFSNKIGEKVASNLCTVIDDGTLKNYRGSITIDDEGTKSHKTVLIKNGILKGYMQDKLNAYLTNTKSTGNSRRQSYAHLPMPRMTNTYMVSGKSSPKDIIESVEYGVYAVNFKGGQVDITSGKFVFSTSEAYLIKNGCINYPIKSVMLIGSGVEVMKSIQMVGNDLSIDGGTGICIKEGQCIPVSVGQPTIKIKKLTVGGIKK